MQDTPTATQAQAQALIQTMAELIGAMASLTNVLAKNSPPPPAEPPATGITLDDIRAALLRVSRVVDRDTAREIALRWAVGGGTAANVPVDKYADVIQACADAEENR